MLDWISVTTMLRVTAGAVALVTALSSFFTIHTKQGGIVERFGKFLRIATEGLNRKLSSSTSSCTWKI